jgi:hypothetical protein
MIKTRLRLLLILCFWASISFANNHVHIDTSKHTDCVKCFVHDHMGSADVPIVSASLSEYQLSEAILPSSIEYTQHSLFTSFDARAPPFNS